MKFRVLVFDYDGTVAVEGALDPAVRAAIGAARDRGIQVLLVTGRILADLARLLPDLVLFDAIVAENGALLHVPRTGQSTLLGKPPPAAFLQELHRRGVLYLAGESVVETDARFAPQVLAAVRELELPLVLLFNRGRLMVLPQSISKGTGVREACRSLRLSLHNAVGFGDAENDHELLEACELGVAVSWGSKALCEVADHVLPGSGPPAVAEFVLGLLDATRLGSAAAARRRLHLGRTAGGTPVTLTLRGRNVLITGAPRSGKSWIAGLLCEQLVLQRYCVCVIDPEGDYTSLEALPGVIVLRGDGAPPPIADVERTLRYPDVSVVVDLSATPDVAKRGYVLALLEALRDLRQETGLPHRIVLDEAHYFLHQAAWRELIDPDLGAYTLVTYRTSQLDPGVLSGTDAVLVSGEDDPREALHLHALQGSTWEPEEWISALASLQVEEAALLPGAEEAGGELVRFRLARRLTAHVRHRRKYLSAQVAPHHAFVFAADGAEGRAAFSLQEVLEVLERQGEAAIAGHLSRGDFSRWIQEVLGDRPLAEDVRALESAWCAGGAPNVADALARTIRARYSSERLSP